MSSLSEVAQIAPDTPRAYMIHLCSYITDNSAVANEVNRQFGTQITAKRVAEVRATLSSKRTTRAHEGLRADEPGFAADDSETRRKVDSVYGSKALADALRNYSGPALVTFRDGAPIRWEAPQSVSYGADQ